LDAAGSTRVRQLVNGFFRTHTTRVRDAPSFTFLLTTSRADVDTLHDALGEGVDATEAERRVGVVNGFLLNTTQRIGEIVVTE
jgi:hypothetical protein